MQRRILIAVVISIFTILASLGLVSYLRVQDSIKRSYADRLHMATIIAKYVEHIMEENLTRLYDISLSDKIDFNDGDWRPEREALRAAYEYSLFTDGVFLLDLNGNVVMTYPYREGGMVNMLSVTHVAKAVSDRRPIISDVYTDQATGKKAIIAVVPLKNRNGEIVGAAGGGIDPTNSMLTRILQTVQADNAGHYIEVIDSNEVVITADKPSRILEHHDHGGALGAMIKEKKAGIRSCSHGYSQAVPSGKARDILAFVPLDTLRWGVIFGQAERDIVAPSKSLKKDFVVLAVIFIASSVLFGVGVTRNIVNPVRELTAAANRIARGYLLMPVENIGTDEVSVLAQSFESMRRRLADSLQSIQLYSVGLERRVYERTLQLEEKRMQNELLLKKLIRSQEDERKRIARELHDESLQSLSAVLLKIEMCRLRPGSVSPEKIEEVKDIISGVITGTNNIIQNLRPTVLDDLGFEAAVVWLVDRNLKERGIDCHLHMDGFSADQITPELEITLFRILQEAISNIARHSNARNVFISIKTCKRTYAMVVEDDGDGFDTSTVFKDTLTGRGLGIMGMKERASLLNGRLTVCSKPGSGTVVLCRIPLGARRDDNG